MLRSSYQRALEPLVIAVHPTPGAMGLHCALLFVAARTPVQHVTLKSGDTVMRVMIPDAYLDLPVPRSYRDVTLEVASGEQE